MKNLFLMLAVPAIVLAMFLAGCSSTPAEVGNVAHGEPKPTTVASIEAKQVAAEQEAPYVVEIIFERNSADLDKAARAKMTAMYKSVPKPELLKSVKVISWADAEYPPKDVKRLTDRQKKLADRRGEAIREFIKTENGKLKFQLYNMAERPGKFGEFVGNSDARIKDSLERAGSTASKARKAIVMFIMEEGKS